MDIIKNPRKYNRIEKEGNELRRLCNKAIAERKLMDKSDPLYLEINKQIESLRNSIEESDKKLLTMLLEGAPDYSKHEQI